MKYRFNLFEFFTGHGVNYEDSWTRLYIMLFQDDRNREGRRGETLIVRSAVLHKRAYTDAAIT